MSTDLQALRQICQEWYCSELFDEPPLEDLYDDDLEDFWKDLESLTESLDRFVAELAVNRHGLADCEVVAAFEAIALGQAIRRLIKIDWLCLLESRGRKSRIARLLGIIQVRLIRFLIASNAEDMA
ncbi:MAG: hypothetical protein U0136_13580 [Bdellovibrionota bacterium]